MTDETPTEGVHEITTGLPDAVRAFLDRYPKTPLMFANRWQDEMRRCSDGDVRPDELLAAFLHDHPHIEVRSLQQPEGMHFWLRHKQAGIVLDKRVFTRAAFIDGGARAYDQFTIAMLRDWDDALTDGETRAVREAAAALGESEESIREKLNAVRTLGLPPDIVNGGDEGEDH